MTTFCFTTPVSIDASVDVQITVEIVDDERFLGVDHSVVRFAGPFAVMPALTTLGYS
jgi:hypothetical protein